jgi:hypothetical protein
MFIKIANISGMVLKTYMYDMPRPKSGETIDIKAISMGSGVAPNNCF